MGNLKIKTQKSQNKLQSTQLLTQQASLYASRFNTSEQYRTIIKRIYLQIHKQQHLFDILLSLNPEQHLPEVVPEDELYNLNEKQEQFLKEIKLTQIQNLDSLYQQLIVQKNKKYSNGLLMDCRSFNVISKEVFEPRSILKSKSIDLVDLRKNVEDIQQYQECKEIGLQLIRQSKVCFVMLAGGQNYDYSPSSYIQCSPIPKLPSNCSLLQILLNKLQALGQLLQTQIHLFILLTSHKKKAYQNILNKMKLKFLKIEFFLQLEYGAIDEDGGIIITKENKTIIHPIGSGDFWNIIQNSREKREKIFNFYFIEVFRVDNLMEHCFDCFLLGEMCRSSAPWVTLCCEKQEEKEILHHPVIYINEWEQLEVRDKEERIYKQTQMNQLQHIYLNHSVISVKFIKQTMSQQIDDQIQAFRIKQSIIKDQAYFSKPQKILVFERDFSQVFKISNQKFTTKGKVVIMNTIDYYSPFTSKNDLLTAASVISKRNHEWLKIPYKNKDNIIQIDPSVSLQGQNLQQYQQYFTSLPQIQFPIFLTLSEQN